MTADAAWPGDALEVGRIGDAWGLKGWFKVQPYAAQPQALLAARRWYLRPAAAPSSSASVGGPTFLEIREAREHGGGLVAAARGIDDRAAAEALRGALVFVARSAFPAPGKDEFYWADLIGLAVVNRQAEPLGTVVGLLDNGPQGVLRVRSDGNPDPDDERLIPFVAAHVDDVDLAMRRIVVDWGLDY